MKKRITILAFIVFWINSLSLSAQVLMSVNIPITQDTLFTIGQQDSLVHKNVTASGQATFSSQFGYVRVLLSDDSDYDLLVYETFPLLAISGIDSFSSIAIESIDLSPNFSFTKIKVEIKNAQLENLLVEITKTNVTIRQQKQIMTDRIALINNNLLIQNALWIAGETPVSQMSYEEKKKLFNGNIPDLQGFEYYIGGVFEWNRETSGSAQGAGVSSYVSFFDWRNRHGANSLSSPYYNNGGHGWVTSVKDQGNLGSCWMFAGSGVTEALLNLYFNQYINLDLSEQDAISCCSSCWGSPYASLNIKTEMGEVVKKIVKQ